MATSAAPVAGVTSNTVPWEILRAAGFAPLLLERDSAATPLADRLMESLFAPRIRVLFDRIASGDWNHLDTVAIPRTSEQEHKLYLYLREAERNGTSARMPRLHLYNLLHARSPEAYQYGLERTRQLAADLQTTNQDALSEAIVESNRARAAIRQLLHLRERGLVEGSEALRLIHHFYSMNRSQFASELEGILPGFAVRKPRGGPRLLIKGTSLDHTALHCAIESLGGFVVAEDDWRGSRAAGSRDVSLEGDPLVAVFEKYYFDTPSPRVFPAADADAWFAAQLSERKADAVVFYLPPEDDVLGWDYPRHREFLKSKAIPSLLIRESAEPIHESAEPIHENTEQGVNPEMRERIGDFLDKMKRTC